MKNIILIIAAMTTLSTISIDAIAVDNKLEEQCRAQATLDRITVEQLDSYVYNCISNHSFADRKSPEEQGQESNSNIPNDPNAADADSKNNNMKNDGEPVQ